MMLLSLIAASSLTAVDRGFVASVHGSVKFTHGSEKAKVLQSSDLNKCIHILAGDRLEVQDEGAKVVLIVDGRRIVMRGQSTFLVPAKPTTEGDLASRTLVKVAATGTIAHPAAPEGFALFAPHDAKNSVSGNIGLFRDGSLPITWVQDGRSKTVQVTIQIKGLPEKKLEPIPATTGSAKGFPFGCVYSKPLGMYLQQYISLMTDQRVTFTISDDAGRTSKTEWTLPKKSEFMRVMNAFAASSANDFEDLDYSIQSAEGEPGNKKSPSYPGIVAGLAVGFLTRHPDSYVGLKYLGTLTRAYHFPGIEQSLSRDIAERERQSE